MNDLGHTAILIVVWLLIAAILFIILLEFKDRRSKKPKDQSDQAASDPVEAALNISVGALFLGPILYFLGMHVFWLGGLKVGQLIGIGMLICSGVSLAKVARAPTDGKSKIVIGIVILVALLVAMLGLAALVMGAGRMRIYQ